MSDEDRLVALEADGITVAQKINRSADRDDLKVAVKYLQMATTNLQEEVDKRSAWLNIIEARLLLAERSQVI